MRVMKPVDNVDTCRHNEDMNTTAVATTTTERVESELRIWAEQRSRRGWGSAFVAPYVWNDTDTSSVSR